MKHLASIACLLLPLALVAAPAKKGRKASAHKEGKPAVHQVVPAVPNPVPASGKLSLPAPHQAVRQLQKSLAQSAKSGRRSLAHVNLGHRAQLRVVTAPQWTTTTPRAPRTFTIAFLNLSW